LFEKPHCPVIAIEEHYWDDELEKTFTGGEAGRPGEQYTRLKDLGRLRLKEMDEAGIDIPQADVMRIYYQDYAKDFPMTTRATWGYTVETATLGIRLVLSGVFEKYPKLKIILGHLGETLPFLVWRIDTTLKRPGGKAANFRDIFCKNFYVTTSGNFSNPALLCCVMEMGIDRILFAVDWPFVPNPPGTKWMDGVPLCDEDKAKILSGNAKRLLKM